MYEGHGAGTERNIGRERGKMAPSVRAGDEEREREHMREMKKEKERERGREGGREGKTDRVIKRVRE